MRDATEKRAFWYRRHGQANLLATVIEVSPARATFFAGCPTSDSSSNYTEVAGLEAAKAHADRSSGCRQPCACPPWVGPVY